MADTEANPFLPLMEMFPDERFNEIGALFDSAFDAGETNDGWKLSGLAVLLHCLGNDEHEENSHLAIPILRTAQALRAAYELGKAST